MRRLILILIVLTLGVTMSLWDVDKNSNNRISPQLNQSDQILQRVSNATTSVNPVTDATTTSGFLKTANGQILGNNGTNNVGLFGFDDTGTMVVKVAKPGYDANSATNDQLIFNSAQNTFKIVKTDTTSIPAIAANYSSVSVPHGLSYIPAFQAYILVLGHYVPLPVVNVNPATGAIISTYSAWSDATNINFDVTVPGGTVGSATPVKYYLFQETAN